MHGTAAGLGFSVPVIMVHLRQSEPALNAKLPLQPVSEMALWAAHRLPVLSWV